MDLRTELQQKAAEQVPAGCYTWARQAKHKPSEVKGSSHTGLLVTRTCTRTSWQGSRVQGKRAESPSK